MFHHLLSAPIQKSTLILLLTPLTAKVDQDVLPVKELHRRLLLVVVVTTTMNKRLSNEVVALA